MEKCHGQINITARKHQNQLNSCSSDDPRRVIGKIDTAYTLVLWLAKNVGFVIAHTAFLTPQYQQTGKLFRKGIRSYQSNDLLPSTQPIIIVILFLMAWGENSSFITVSSFGKVPIGFLITQWGLDPLRRKT